MILGSRIRLRPVERADRPRSVERPFAIDAQSAEGWTPIGSAGFHTIGWRNRHAELGFAIGDKQYWNRDFGTDTIKTLVGFGFGELNLERMFLRGHEENARAIRCYEKAGFAHPGRLRRDRFHNGKYSDTLILGILRDEWEAREK